MAKDRKSLTIDNEVNAGIKKEAKKQRRSFSGMVEFICSEFLIALEKTKIIEKNK